MGFRAVLAPGQWAARQSGAVVAQRGTSGDAAVQDTRGIRRYFRLRVSWNACLWVHILCMSPRNHAACIQRYCTAILINTPAACWHSSGWRRSPDAGWLRVIRVRWWIRWMRCDRLAKDQPAEITMFQISEVQESSGFNRRRSFLAL